MVQIEIGDTVDDQAVAPLLGGASEPGSNSRCSTVRKTARSRSN